MTNNDLEHCRSFTFRAGVGECVIVEPEQYVQESSLEMQVSLASEKESRA